MKLVTNSLLQNQFKKKILQSDEDSQHGKDPADVTKLSEQIAKSVSKALLSYLDLLATNGFVKLGLRATLHTENVSLTIFDHQSVQFNFFFFE